MENKRHNIELADIFRSSETVFLQGHNLCATQLKAFDAIVRCRTSALGGHTDCCNNCGYVRQSYNSCRNRHCPKCQFVKKAQWIDKLAGNLPPVKHFHIVYTIPACLHNLFYINQRVAYNLIFRAVGQTLLKCAANPEFLGAQAGAVAILHTWGQTLTYHPHIHMIVPAGGLSEDLMEWIPSKKKFFLPVKTLSTVFRGILVRLLQLATDTGELKLPCNTTGFDQIKTQCYLKKWVVYCEKPFSCADNLIRYLGNYTHRVAISNSRICSFDGKNVTFYYKDYKSAGRKRVITIDAAEFIRRFMQHVLPDGFYKIRYVGFMALCNMKVKLQACSDLIEKAAFIPALEGLTAMEVLREITGKDPFCCPICMKGRMIRIAINLSGPE